MLKFLLKSLAVETLLANVTIEKLLPFAGKLLIHVATNDPTRAAHLVDVVRWLNRVTESFLRRFDVSSKSLAEDWPSRDD